MPTPPQRMIPDLDTFVAVIDEDSRQQHPVLL